MAILERFSAPAGMSDPRPAEWSAKVKGIFAHYVGSKFPQLYDPTAKNTPPDAQRPMIPWAAFPADLRATEPSQERRWPLADGDRELQDEYCEWTVERSGGKIAKVTFTTEVPEYWEHLFHNAPAKLLALYRKHVDPRVEFSDLRDSNGNYRRENKWNTSRPGRLAHMMQRNNTLGAAIDLVANATIQRVRNGKPVTQQQDLVRCAELGESLRNSDPQIAAAANEAVRSGGEITLADPIGLYLRRPITAGMVTPDDADAAKFWTVERGDARHTLRARFEVPPKHGYAVGDIHIGGRPIEFGGQVAERVQVWISPCIKKGRHKVVPRPCVGS
jgi:hypothetical protein